MAVDQNGMKSSLVTEIKVCAISFVFLLDQMGYSARAGLGGLDLLPVQRGRAGHAAVEYASATAHSGVASSTQSAAAGRERAQWLEDRPRYEHSPPPTPCVRNQNTCCAC